MSFDSFLLLVGEILHSCYSFSASEPRWITSKWDFPRQVTWKSWDDLCITSLEEEDGKMKCIEGLVSTPRSGNLMSCWCCVNVSQGITHVKSNRYIIDWFRSTRQGALCAMSVHSLRKIKFYGQLHQMAFKLLTNIIDISNLVIRPFWWVNMKA